MKRLFILILIVSVSFVQCSPEDYTIESLASISVTNAAPGSPAIDMLIDGLVSNPDTLIYRKTSVSKSTTTLPYLPIGTGARELVISTHTGNINLASATKDFETGKSYSAFVYDTIQSGKLMFVRFNDDLTLPAASMTHVRFLHLAPNAGNVDVTLVRTSATPNDSVTISNKGYIGASPDINSLSTFLAIPGGTYTANIKEAGTGTVILSVSLNTASTQLSTGRIVTLYAAGTAQGVPLTLNGIRHY